MCHLCMHAISYLHCFFSASILFAHTCSPFPFRQRVPVSTVRTCQSYHSHLAVMVLSRPIVVVRTAVTIVTTVMALVAEIDTNCLHLHSGAEWSDHWPSSSASPGYLIIGLCYIPQCSACESGRCCANVALGECTICMCVNESSKWMCAC